MGKIFEKNKIINLVCYVAILVLFVISFQKCGINWNQDLLFLVKALVVLSIISVIVVQQHKLHIKVLDVVIFIWHIYIITHIIIDKEIPNGRSFIVYSALFFLYGLMRIITSSSNIKKIYVEIIFLGAILFELSYGYYQLIISINHFNQFSIIGNFLNPGLYSAYILMGIAMAIYNMKNRIKDDVSIIYKAKYGISIIIIVLGFPMLLVTMSRDAIFCAIGIGFWIYRKQLKKNYLPTVIISALLIPFLIYIKYGSILGRCFIYYISLRMFIKNWFFGAGINSFIGMYGRELRYYFANHQDNILTNYIDSTCYVFCDPLKIMTEQGVIGLLISVIACWIIIKKLRSYSMSLTYGLSSLLIFSLFSYPFELIPYQVILIFFASICNMVSDSQNKKINNTNRIRIYLFCILSLIVSYSMTKYTAFRTDAQNKLSVFGSPIEASLIKYYYQYYPENIDNKNYLMDFANLLRQNRRYRDSNAILRDANKISNDPMYLIMMGNNYQDMGLFNEALRSYQQAFNTLPNRIYPLYCEMKLYEHINDKKYLIMAANRVVCFQPKITSPVTEQMKSEARKILNDLNKTK